jgi:hypothetical protein
MFRRKIKNTIFELTHEKYRRHERISYEEYVILLSTNDETWFVYNDLNYQVVHENSITTTMVVSKISGNKYQVVKTEDFHTIVDLLHNFRVDGLLIKDIWDKTSF